MDRIVLVRHAQASFGAEDYDKLSPLGHQQSDWLAQYFRDHELRFDRVFRGSLRRHRETTQAVEDAILTRARQLRIQDGRL